MKIKPGLIIELNDQYLKLVAVSAFSQHPSRLKAVVKPVTFLNDSQIIKVIVDSLKENKVKSRAVIICLSRNQVICRNLNLPSQDVNEIKQMVELNIARIVPEKKEQIIYSCKVYGIDERGHSKVMILIAQKDLIRRQLDIYELAGLSVEMIVLSSYGSLGMVRNKHKNIIKPDELNLILEIDSGFTDLIMFSGNELLYSRSINLGSSQLSDDNDIRKLIGEIRQSLVIFHNEEISQKPARIFLNSPLPNIDKMASMMQDELSLEVKKYFTTIDGQADIPANVSLAALIEFISGRSIEKAVEFLIPEIEVRKTLRKTIRDLMTLGVAVLCLCVSFGGIFYGRFFHRQSYYNTLTSKNKKLAFALSDSLKEFQETSFVKDKLLLRKVPLSLLSYLQKNLPQEIALKSLSMDRDRKIILKGEAQQLSDIFKFVGLLEQVSYFKEIKTRSTRKRRVGGKEVTDFELNFTLAIE